MDLETQKRLTKAYIDSDPLTIQLIPQARTKTTSGGYVTTPGTPRQAQTFKLIALAYVQRPTITLNGVERTIEYHLLGEWDSIMEVGDYWLSNGNRFEVVSLDAGHGYEKKGLIERTVYP